DHLRHAGMCDIKYFMGVDFALSNDGTAAVVSHYDRNCKLTADDFPEEMFSYNDVLAKYFDENEFLVSPRIIIDYAEVRYAGQPPWEDYSVMMIDEVLGWVQDLFLRWPIQCGMYDQWSGEILKQMISGRGINRLEMVTHTAALNDSMFKLFSMCMHQGQLLMPWWKDLEKELLSLQCYVRSQGIIKVEAPPGPKNHDDLFSALIRSVYLCYSYIKKNKILASSLPLLFKEGKLVKDLGNFKGVYNYMQY
ncbi:unnamed protein product, partial [marine sediment metagenome]